MVFGRSGGVWGHGMDHTRRFPRIPARFCLTWHGENRLSCFFGILETHFITKYLRIGPRASRLVLGSFFKARVPSQELSNKLIFPKMTPKRNIARETWQPPKIVIFIKRLPYVCLFRPLFSSAAAAWSLEMPGCWVFYLVCVSVISEGC